MTRNQEEKRHNRNKSTGDSDIVMNQLQKEN